MKKKKRPIILIEVLVSFALIAMIVGSLLMYLRRVIFLQAKLKRVETEILSRAHIQQQLHYLFSNIEYGEGREFFTVGKEKDPELHFYFDNKVDIDGVFSGTVKGTLRNKEKELVIEIRPLNTDQMMRECVIARGVDSLSWRFISFNEISNRESSSLWPRGSCLYPDVFSLLLEIKGTIHIFPVFLFKNFSGISYFKKEEGL